MTEAATAVAFPHAPVLARPGRRVALGLLAAIGTINFIDRQILSVLVEPMRVELHFTDTQFGFLTGLSFAVFYALLGVPVAILADRTHRVRLVAVACLLWSLFTGVCGFATTFWQLALARFGVGVGKAGGTAPSLSILADYYPPEQRAIVTGVFTVNGPLGVFLGSTLGALAASYIGWRGAFFSISALGMIATPLLLLCVREPQRGIMEAGRAPIGADGKAAATPFLQTAGLFFKRPTLGLLLLASGLSAFVSYGMLNWIPAYLMRVQHMPLSELARWFGPAAGLCMGIGIWGGGALVNAAGKRSPKAYALIPALSMLINAPAFALALFAPSWQVSLTLLLLPMICVTMYVAPALALVTNMAPVTARATATALLLLAFNIIGLGGGPLSIGILSDLFTHAHGASGLQAALFCVVPVSVIAAAAYYAMSRTVVADMARSQSEQTL
jgi:MFS family permease